MTKMKRNIILIGGGGHCKAVIDVIEKEGKYQVEGIIDIKKKLGTECYGYKIVGTDEDLREFARHYKYFFITIGHLGVSRMREPLF